MIILCNIQFIHRLPCQVQWSLQFCRKRTSKLVGIFAVVPPWKAPRVDARLFRREAHNFSLTLLNLNKRGFCSMG